MTSEDDLIAYASGLSGAVWRRLTTAVSWAARRGEAGAIPPELEEWRDIVTDPDAWLNVRRRVNNERQRLYRRTREERQQEARLQRRYYMRAYMARYRRRDRP